MGAVYAASIDGVLQQASQLLPVGLSACTVGHHHICTTPQVAEVEIIEAGPALQSTINGTSEFIEHGATPASVKHYMGELSAGRQCTLQLQRCDS